MQLQKPHVLILASGGKNPDEGGSGARELYEYSLVNRYNVVYGGALYEIAGVVSNREHGGVWQKMNEAGGGHLFEYAPGPYDEEFYMRLAQKYQPDIIMLSGWLRILTGEVLNTLRGRIINIHPGPLPLTAGLHGHLVHERVKEEFDSGEISYTECVMHFVDKVVDNPELVFFRHRVSIRKGESAESIARRVNEKERAWQAVLLGLVANRFIWLSDSGSVQFWDQWLRRVFLP